MQEHMHIIKKANLFKQLNGDDLSYIMWVGKVETFKPGSVLIEENTIGDELYLILEGKVNIYASQSMPNGADTQQNILAEVGPGESVGDMSFIDGSARSATVKAKEPVVALVLHKADFTFSNPLSGECLYKIAANISRINIQRLREQNQSYVKYLIKDLNHAQERSRYGKFLILTLAAFAISVSMNMLATKYGINTSASWFIGTYLILLILPVIFFIKEFNYKFAAFGLTKVGLKQAVGEGLLLSVFVTSFMILIYCAAHHYLYHLTLAQAIESLQFSHIFKLKVLAYLPYAFVQEFIARGVIQTSMQQFLDDRKGVKSVIYCSILFSIGHMHYSLHIVSLTFMLSVGLGLFYIRNRNLAGVTILHFFMYVVAILLGML